MLRRANTTEYGLASGVFTKDLSKALYISEKLEAGTVFINTYNKTDVAAPFGGFKQSGFGKDLGKLLSPSLISHLTVQINEKTTLPGYSISSKTSAMDAFPASPTLLQLQ